MKKLFAFALFAVLAFAQPQPSIPLGAASTIQGLAGTGNVVTYTVFGAVQNGLSQSLSYQVLAQGQLGSSNAVLYTVPSPAVTFVTLIHLANTSGSAVTGISLGLNGSAATAAKQLLSGVTLPANGFATLTPTSWQIHDVNGSLLQSAALPSQLCASLSAASGAIANTEAQVAGCTLPANFLQVGTTILVTAAGSVTTSTSPGNQTFNIRIGSTSLSGNIAATVAPTATASITAQPFSLSCLVTVRTTGSSGTAVGQCVATSTNVSTGAFTALNVIGLTTVAVAVDTTAQKIVELTFDSGAASASATFQNAAIEVVKM